VVYVVETSRQLELRVLRSNPARALGDRFYAEKHI
jgi:hypothetical protein